MFQLLHESANVLSFTKQVIGSCSRVFSKKGINKLFTFCIFHTKGLAGSFIKRETLAQVLSQELCKIFKNIFFTEHLWATASEFEYLLAFEYFLFDIFLAF